MDVLKVVLSSFFSIITLFILAKIMGHKQISQLDFFDYLNGITIGSVAAELATELDEPYKPFIAMLCYCAASVLISKLALKWNKSRKYINGTPTILLKGDKIYKDNLKKAKLELSEFMVMTREAGYFNLDDIELAVFEFNGKLSILPKASARPLNTSDINIKPEPSKIYTELIMDGEILKENLVRQNLSQKWLDGQIKSHGYRDKSEILLCLYRNDGKIIFYS
jgi:uncharacterized membrane protein YcaP (DUF421 family)